ncbi:MAG: hypothetical protein M1834_005775 [Cirrosporium novae-zelandiae]|nr:MAG: hypothetical protein M1834_005775 [Cirrosporium novae-zelandiae]
MFTMLFEDWPVELVLEVMGHCCTVNDVLNLAFTCHKFRTIFTTSRKLPILAAAAEREYGPLKDAIQLVTHNSSQPAHIIRNVPFSIALLKQIAEVGRAAKKWEDIYPVKKWKLNFEKRRLLRNLERYHLRRAIYRLWLYNRAFHNRNYPRTTRVLRSIVQERAELLHNWNSQELAEIEDVRDVLREVLQHHVCPSNGTIQRKFRKRYPEADQQLLFNIHLNYPPPPTTFQQHFYTVQQVNANNKYQSRYHIAPHHEIGGEGWGDEIPHHYVVEDMLKLDPGQILWLRDNALLKQEVEAFVRNLGDWFENNGETFGQTLEWVLDERGEDIEDLKNAVKDGDLGIAIDVN